MQETTRTPQGPQQPTQDTAQPPTSATQAPSGAEQRPHTAPTPAGPAAARTQPHATVRDHATYLDAGQPTTFPSHPSAYAGHQRLGMSYRDTIGYHDEYDD